MAGTVAIVWGKQGYSRHCLTAQKLHRSGDSRKRGFEMNEKCLLKDKGPRWQIQGLAPRNDQHYRKGRGHYNIKLIGGQL